MLDLVYYYITIIKRLAGLSGKNGVDANAPTQYAAEDIQVNTSPYEYRMSVSYIESIGRYLLYSGDGGLSLYSAGGTNTGNETYIQAGYGAGGTGGANIGGGLTTNRQGQAGGKGFIEICYEQFLGDTN